MIQDAKTAMEESMESVITFEFMEKLQKLYKHEIKIKRVKKELQCLFDEGTQFVKINPPIVSLYFFYLPLVVRTSEGKPYEFMFRLDADYPFNKPQLICNKNIGSTRSYSESRDLMCLLLKDHEKWGPSFTLSRFLPSLRSLADLLQSSTRNKQFVNAQPILGKYYQFDYYEREELIQSGLKLFHAKEKVKKFMMIKNTEERVLGLGEKVILLFTDEGNSKLKLLFWSPIKQVSHVIVQQEKNLILEYPSHSRNHARIKLIIQDKLSEILQIINPIQMIERRVSNLDSSSNGSVDQGSVISDYNELITYYAMRDESKSQFYFQKMKQVLMKHAVESN